MAGEVALEGAELGDVDGLANPRAHFLELRAQLAPPRGEVAFGGQQHRHAAPHTPKGRGGWRSLAV
eukprot:scaffold238944_cov33-Tisochrysis_lutea.AAC.7